MASGTRDPRGAQRCRGGSGEAPTESSLEDIFEAIPEQSKHGARPCLAITLLPDFADSQITPLSTSGGGKGIKALFGAPDTGTLRTNQLLRDPSGLFRADYSASCPEELVQELLQAAEAHKVLITSITPADFAWAAAASESTGDNHQTSCVCAIQLNTSPGETRLLAVNRAEPVALRRLPLGAPTRTTSRRISELAGWMIGIGLAKPRVLALGDLSFRETIAEAAEAVGLPVLPPTGIVAELGSLPGPVAAAFAGHGPRFVPRAIMDRAKARRRRQGWLAAVATVVFLAGAAFLETVNLTREISAVRDAREELQEEVGTVLRARDRTFALATASEELNQARAQTPRWTSVLTGISEALPVHSFVSQARMAGDSLFLELEGPDAASALEALGQMPGLSGFRASAPVVREVNGGNEVIERFRAVATVSWPHFQPAEEDGS